MASNRSSIDAAMELLNDLSSAQSTLRAMNEDLLRAVVDSREDVPALRQRVLAQHARIQAITDHMMVALRDT